jgi:uncharacterized protein
MDQDPQPSAARVPMLGLGWGFPVERRALDGAFTVAADEAAVRRSIALILGTAKGERVMRPDFGSNLHRLLFAPNNGATRAAVEFEVREALLLWEPRIEVLDVAAHAAGERGEAILVDIGCRVRSTDNRFNLVYPFYLARTVA